MGAWNVAACNESPSALKNPASAAVGSSLPFGVSQVSQSVSQNLSELELRLAALQRAQRTREIDRLGETALSGPADPGVAPTLFDAAA